MAERRRALAVKEKLRSLRSEEMAKVGFVVIIDSARVNTYMNCAREVLQNNN